MRKLNFVLFIFVFVSGINAQNFYRNTTTRTNNDTTTDDLTGVEMAMGVLDTIDIVFRNTGNTFTPDFCPVNYFSDTIRVSSSSGSYVPASNASIQVTVLNEDAYNVRVIATAPGDVYIMVLSDIILSGCGAGAVQPGGSHMISISGGTFPVELLFFTAQQVEQDLKFAWATASELNNDFFLLEEEITPGNFIEVPNSFTEGAGTSTETQHYSFSMNSVSPGTHYFRLKQVDTDPNTFSYSNTVAVDVKSVEASASAVLEVRGSQLFVQGHNVQGQKVQIQIFNALGQVAVSIPIFGQDAANGKYVSTGDLDLGRGVYFATLSIESSSLREVKTIKFVSN